MKRNLNLANSEHDLAEKSESVKRNLELEMNAEYGYSMSTADDKIERGEKRTSAELYFEHKTGDRYGQAEDCEHNMSGTPIARQGAVSRRRWRSA